MIKRKSDFGFIIFGAILTLLFSLHSSCGKTVDQSNPFIDSNILISHVWYPYMINIKETDSGNVFFSNKDTIVKKDTTFYFSDCFQKSTYTFNHDNVLKITNGCDLTPQDPATTVWNITSTGGMELPIISDRTFGPVMGIGELKEIDQSHFVFNSPYNTQTAFGDSGYIQFSRNIYITFRNK